MSSNLGDCSLRREVPVELQDVDSSGAVYVAGRTTSTNYPTKSAAQGTNAGGWDAVVTKLAAGGASMAGELYAAMLRRFVPKAEVDTVFPSDAGATLPKNST